MQKFMEDEKSKSLFLNSQYLSNLFQFTNQYTNKDDYENK